MKPVKNFGDYAAIAAAHTAAMQNKWIARMGYDAKRGQFWIEYIARAH